MCDFDIYDGFRPNLPFVAPRLPREQPIPGVTINRPPTFTPPHMSTEIPPPTTVFTVPRLPHEQPIPGIGAPARNFDTPATTTYSSADPLPTAPTDGPATAAAAHSLGGFASNFASSGSGAGNRRGYTHSLRPESGRIVR